MFYTLQIESEKVIKELNKMKAEISETISQKQLLKEANVRLTAQLEAMVEDSNVSLNIKFVYGYLFINSLLKLTKNVYFHILGYAECNF